MSNTIKKIALVSHEFGLMRNGGGIASYLYSFAKTISSQFPDMEIYVVTCHFHEKCDLMEYPNFHVHVLKSTVLSKLGLEVLDILKQVQPDYVETTDYLGLSLESMLYKILIGRELEHTVFMQYTHTASREIYEWGGYGEIENAPRRFKVAIGREWAQAVLADVVISPSQFLRKYVSDKYSIKKPEYVPYVFRYEKKDRNQMKKAVEELYDVSDMNQRFVVTYLSRFENRKNQKLIVNVFKRFLEEVDQEAILLLIGNGIENVSSGKNFMLEVYQTIPDKYKQNIRFFEFANAEEKMKFFSVSDVSVMTSPYENFPFAMIETVCAGIPIMVSAYNGCCDFMGENKGLTSFDPFSEDNLFDNLKKFHALSERQRRSVACDQMKNLEELCNLENSFFAKFSLFEKNGVRDTEVKDEKRAPLMVLKREKDVHLEIKEDTNLLIVPEGQFEPDIAVVESVLQLVERKRAEFVISLGNDSLHTDAYAALEEGFPILLTHVESCEGVLKDVLQELIETRKNEYFSVPIQVQF